MYLSMISLHAAELVNEIKAMINVSIGLPETAGSIVVDADGKIWLVLPNYNINASGTIPNATVNVSGTDYNIIFSSTTLNVNGVATPAQNADITSLYTAIKKGIEDSINGMKDKVSTTVDKFLNKIINAENKIFNKVSAIAANPNRYIQPALIAKSADFGFFYPSRYYDAPTQIKKGTKIMFYPTTLTGEVVAPAFKKFVAVCGAWEVDDMTKDKDATPFNTGDVMKTVFDGNIYNMSNPFEYTVDAPAGTVLEIIYETLGYNGKVAGKKYYIEVFE